MLKNYSLVIHQQMADYRKPRVLYSNCGPAFLKERIKVTRTIVHI
jgi:hypothetical protein